MRPRDFRGYDFESFINNIKKPFSYERVDRMSLLTRNIRACREQERHFPHLLNLVLFPREHENREVAHIISDKLKLSIPHLRNSVSSSDTTQSIVATLSDSRTRAITRLRRRAFLIVPSAIRARRVGAAAAWKKRTNVSTTPFAWKRRADVHQRVALVLRRGKPEPVVGDPHQSAGDRREVSVELSQSGRELRV
jgi:hypothetical protein